MGNALCSNSDQYSEISAMDMRLRNNNKKNKDLKENKENTFGTSGVSNTAGSTHSHFSFFRGFTSNKNTNDEKKS